MQIFVTTDTHFNHKKLIEWGRPEDFERRIRRTHAIIPGDAVLIHLGDFCIGKDEEMHKRWMDRVGHIKHRILVRGNHDHKSNNWYLEHGWSMVVDQLVLDLYGKKVIFSHIPVNHELWAATDINVHGHTHGNTHRDIDIQDFYKPDIYHKEIALENTHYQPVVITEKFLK